MGKGSCEAPFMTEPRVSTTGPSDSARWMTTNMEYGKFYRSTKQEAEERKSLHAECQKKCEALTKELRDCQAQLELLRLRTFPEPTAEERPAASPQAYRSTRGQSISPRSYLEDHLKGSGCRDHVEKELELECELVSAHSGKVKELERKDEKISVKARELEKKEAIHSIKKKDLGRKEHISLKARDLERKEEIHSIKKKDLGRKEDNIQMGRKEEQRQEESYSGKKKDVGRKEADFPEKSRDMGRKEEDFVIKSRELGVYQGNQAMDRETAAMGESTKQIDHSERSLLKSHLLSKRRIPIKRGPHEDMERMYPNKRNMFEHREKQLIQNQAPHYINPATSRYNFYKYYGYAGQGAKTSWGHNRPLGLEPPYAAKARILPLGQEPFYSTRARGFHN